MTGRFQYTAVVETDASSGQLVEAVGRALVRQGAKIQVAATGKVSGQVGSSLRTRLLGGARISAAHLPVRISGASASTDEGLVASVAGAEATGFWSPAGMEGRLRGRCQQVALEVADHSATQLIAAGHIVRRLADPGLEQ